MTRAGLTILAATTDQRALGVPLVRVAGHELAAEPVAGVLCSRCGEVRGAVRWRVGVRWRGADERCGKSDGQSDSTIRCYAFAG